jgi:outer membrane protein assembly factor BamB
MGAIDRQASFSGTKDVAVPLRFDAPFLCHQGLLLAGASSGILLALDVETGAEKWRIEIDGILLGSPNSIDAEHIVLLDQGAGALHCIETKTGKIKWTTEGVERCDGSPGVGDGRVAFGSCLSALHVYDSSDGKHLRNIVVGDDAQVAGGVAIAGNQAFFGSRDGRLVNVNLEKGTIVWTSEESVDQTFSTPALSKDRVVYTSDDGFVYAVDRTIGRTVWKYDTSGYCY